MAKVIVLAGPSGAGKSHLAARVGLPILRLDDFYREIDDPTLPDPIDWDDVTSWHCEDAMRAIEELCREGTTEVPAYDISTSRRVGTRTLALDGAQLFVAEGIFAQEVIAPCRERGLLAEALCITQQPLLTAIRRLTRDLREHRKPVPVLLERGWRLMRRKPGIVRDAVAKGAREVSPDQAFEILSALR